MHINTLKLDFSKYALSILFLKCKPISFRTLKFLFKPEFFLSSSVKDLVIKN